MSTGEIPLAPGGLPLLGHLLPMLRDPVDFLASLPVHGDAVRIRLGTASVIVVCTPELTRQVLLNDRVFDKGGPIFDRIREVAGNGLGTCPHSDHRRQRRLVQPAFHRDRMPGYAEVMAAQIRSATDRWRTDRDLDVLAELTHLTATTLVETMLSSTLSPTTLHDAVEDLATVMSGIYRRTIAPQLNVLPTPGNRRYFRARTRLRKMLSEIIADRRNDGTDRGDLLSALLVAQDTDGTGQDQGLTDTEISDQVISLFLAGAEATATALAWALHLVAIHPDIERRLHDEVDRVLCGGSATFTHLPELEMTGRVVTETLRLYPPVWMFSRTVTADTRLGDHSVPAGSAIIFSPYLVHHRGDLFDEPDSFDPDRWDGRRPQPPRNGFIPFGSGARKCVGDEFGTNEVVLALATITARWRLVPASRHEVRPAAALALTPRGLRMRVIDRAEPLVSPDGVPKEN
ncbi:cytochrome P450 [Streptomyces sp. NPDC051662]|uniref:cytochrome P450 n=1 Tax=Streptomyces sp. NPDC051662 TaxID=3154750 RepID=UPI0034419417